MPTFITGHGSHPDWRMALAMAGAQLDTQALPAAPTLGFVYLTDAYAGEAEALLGALRARWPAVAWVGSVGVGVSACGVEYFDEPALALMLSDLPREHRQLFSGSLPLTREDAFSALVHADPATHDLAELLHELAARTRSGYLFGGLAAARQRTLHIADAVLQGGLSGVAFTQDVALVSRVTQGCQPVGPVRSVTEAEDQVVYGLDGRGALQCLLADLDVALDNPRAAVPRLRATLVGLSDGDETLVGRTGQFGADTRVRHLIGLDPLRGGVALGDRVSTGMRLAFCSRDVQAARRDLVRICSEIRDELAPEGGGAPQRMAGAIYVSCSGRGGPHFGGPSAELQILRHALGELPLVGFFAAGEVARHHLYGYTGVLTVFTAPAGPAPKAQ